MNTFYIALIIILIISSITDIKKRIIPNKLIVSGAVLGIYLNIANSTKEIIFFSITVFIILLLSPLKSGGDVKLLTLCVLYLGYEANKFFIILALVMFTVMIYKKFKNQAIKSLPLAPFIFVATILSIAF